MNEHRNGTASRLLQQGKKFAPVSSINSGGIRRKTACHYPADARFHARASGGSSIKFPRDADRRWRHAAHRKTRCARTKSAAAISTGSPAAPPGHQNPPDSIRRFPPEGAPLPATKHKRLTMRPVRSPTRAPLPWPSARSPEGRPPAARTRTPARLALWTVSSGGGSPTVEFLRTRDRINDKPRHAQEPKASNPSEMSRFRPRTSAVGRLMLPL